MKIGPPPHALVLFFCFDLLFNFTCLDHITKSVFSHFYHLSIDALHFDLFSRLQFYISPKKDIDSASRIAKERKGHIGLPMSGALKSWGRYSSGKRDLLSVVGIFIRH